MYYIIEKARFFWGVGAFLRLKLLVYAKKEVFMKKVRNISGLGFAGALMFCAVVCLGTAVPAGAQTDATEYCEIALSRCPEQYDGDTLEVPLSVVSLSSTIRACATTDSNKVGEPPAIMFVIDHSNSMVTAQPPNTRGNDVNGNRYRVTREIIETISGSFPDALIGVAIFDAGLYLNNSRGTDPNSVKFGGTPFNDTTGESYMPLLKLNDTVSGGGFLTADNTAYQLYQRMITSASVQGQTRWGVRSGAANPPLLAEGSGTNITIGFEAALEQFAKIPESVVKPENRYIIFLSDGEPGITGTCSGANGTTGDNPRCARQRLYEAGVIDGKKFPTTYTVYLNAAPRDTADYPATLKTMTNAVKNNGYSDVNNTSGIWAIDGNNYDAMLNLMMDNIVSKMLQTKVVPKRIVVTSAGVTDSAGNLVDTSFSFGRMLPIDTTSIAVVRMGLRYDVKKDSIDDNGNTVQVDFETVQEYSFAIKRTATPKGGNNWASSQGLTPKCGSKPSIELLYGGEPVDVIKGNMKELTVKFAASNFFDYTRDNVNIQIRMTEGGPVNDTLYTNRLTLRPEASSFYWNFDRVYVDAVGQVNVTNSVLEHNTISDSLILFFRNPIIPLDTIRVSYPYISHILAFDVKGERIMSGDTVKGVRAGELVDIFARTLRGDGTIDAEMLASGNVAWTSQGATITPTGLQTQFMATKADKDGTVYEVTAVFQAGSMKITEKFYVKVMPGQAEYLEVVFVDPSKVPNQADTTKLKNNKTLEIPEKMVRDTTLYVVERDKFGNLIGPASGASWSNIVGGICFRRSAEGNDCATARGDNVDVGKPDGSSVKFDQGRIIVTKSGLSDTVNVTVLGEAQANVGPNPFVPGVDEPEPRLRQYGVWETYKDIVEAKSVGGPNGGSDTKGILVAVTTPKGIQADGSGKHPKTASVVIYDAVGNIVFKSKPNEITLTNGRSTFGLVWNGKNNKGRVVGPGTYLVRTSVELDGGGKVVEQKRIGVTKAK
jgi:hypothetical protein